MACQALEKQTRVVKKLAAWQPGALKLARRYGDALVCVRYRRDLEGQRYTTVELVVDVAPVQPRGDPAEIVGVRIALDEKPLQALARRHGARWDGPARLWRMSRGAARVAGLTQRIVRNLPDVENSNGRF